MKSISWSPLRTFPSNISIILRILFVAVALNVTTGCGSGGPSSGERFSGSTEVTVVITATANDQLAEYDLGFQDITLL